MAWIETYVLLSALLFLIIGFSTKTSDTISFIVIKLVPLIFGLFGNCRISIFGAKVREEGVR